MHALQMHWGDSAVLIPVYFKDHSTNGVFNGPVCDLVHIDGDHSAEAARRDFENLFPMMNCNSHILMDDVFDDGSSGPGDVWRELLAQGVLSKAVPNLPKLVLLLVQSLWSYGQRPILFCLVGACKLNILTGIIGKVHTLKQAITRIGAAL